jgi:addiction module HigA family antidote
MSKRSQLPPSPGDVLRNKILRNIDVTQEELAVAMRVSRFSVNQIMNGRRTITAEMSLRLAYVTGTKPEFWLQLQSDIDLYNASIKLRDELPKLRIVRQEERGYVKPYFLTERDF